jgi:hypothetical protein
MQMKRISVLPGKHLHDQRFEPQSVNDIGIDQHSGVVKRSHREQSMTEHLGDFISGRPGLDGPFPNVYRVTRSKWRWHRLMFVVHQEYGLADFSVPQRNTTRIAGTVVDHDALDAETGKRCPIFAEKVIKSPRIQGRYLEFHGTNSHDDESRLYSCEKSKMADIGPLTHCFFVRFG